MNQPARTTLWLPRDDEHDLAASLGMCEPDRDLLRKLVEQAQDQAARDHPGTRVVVKRWHVWRVVRQLNALGQLNTPDGRAAAYASLASKNE